MRQKTVSRNNNSLVSQFTLIYVFLLILFLFSVSVKICASNGAQLVKQEITNRIFHAQIDGKYPITIYLEYQHRSECFLETYSVKGWYYYDKIKTKIPLVGIYDEGLVLYNFATPNQENVVLNFEQTPFNCNNDFFKSITNFNEKFVIQYIDSLHISGVWKNKAKELEVMFDLQSLNIKQTNNYLLLPNKQWLCLNDYFYVLNHYELIAVSDDNSRAIVKFESPSRNYVMGRCGAGSEKGYYCLYLDENSQLLRFEEFLVESCLDGIFLDQIKLNNTHIIVSSSKTEDETIRLTIDLQNVSIQQETLLTQTR